jgi:hypothetical protein
MPTTQPTSLRSRFSHVYFHHRRFVHSCLAAAGLTLLLCGAAHAQGGVPLTTVATDQSSLNLSTQFGVPAGGAINQTGDFAFVGSGDTALFLRAAGASSATRLLQIDDPAPGFPGSEILSISPELSLNASRVLLFGARFTGGDHLPHAALLTYDGTNYHTVVSSDGFTPGSTSETYGLNLYPGSINDSGDVNFAAIPTTVLATTYYIVPSGGTPVRILGLNDNPPPPCTTCFLPGVPVTGGVISGSPLSLPVPRLNAKGQMLFSLWNGLFIGSKDGTVLPVCRLTSGACSIQPITTGTNLSPFLGGTAFLNDVGAVAFTNPPDSTSVTICVAPPGGGAPAAVVTSGDPAPAGVGGGTILSPVALGFDDSGDIVYQATISGSNLTTFALLRYHPSNAPTDVVAYNCEAAPGANGKLFAPPPALLAPCGSSIFTSPAPSAFSGVSIANTGTVSFDASLTGGGSAIYRQTGADPPMFISLEYTGTSILSLGVGIGISSAHVFSDIGETEILNNGSVFFASYLTTGAADFAVYLGTPVSVQTLMSTADSLPLGARTILGSTPPKAAGHFVVFTAQPAAGRTNLLESDLTSGTITRVVSDNDPAFASAGGPGADTVLAPNFFLNDSGQVAFETIGQNAGFARGVVVFGSGSTVDTAWLGLPATCGAIYLWSPSGGLKKVAADGDAVPNSTAKFWCVTLNENSPSPLSRSGDVVFSNPSAFGPALPCTLCDGPPGIVNGDFLYSAPGTISEIAAANDTLPGQSVPTSFVPSLSVPVNSAGQVAFGAELGTSTWGLYLRNGDAAQKVIANNDPVLDGTGAAFEFPHFIAGLTDSGNLAFTGSTNLATDGLFLAAAGGAIQTLALDRGSAPASVGGTFSLAPSGSIVPNPPPGTFNVGVSPFQNFAAINNESDVAFSAAITSGSADSGYFRVLQMGPAAGTVQAVAWQGEVAPGGGTFNTFSAPNSLLNIRSPNFSLGPDGALAFVNLFTDAPGRLREGMFVARPDGTLVKVLTNGDPLPLPGGGAATSLSLSPKLAAGDAGKFAFLAGIAGGSARRAIFVTAIPAGTAATSVTLGQPQSPAVAQQSVALTATVTSAATTAQPPTGTVQFFANGISLGSPAPLSAGGQATLMTSSLAAGPDSIIAQYDGDSNYSPGNSAPITIVAAGFAPPPAQLSVAGGQSLVIPLTAFAPSGSNMNFMLSCSGLPANASCMFDANPVAPGPGGTTVKLTFTTMGGSKLPPIRPQPGTPALRDFGIATLLAALFAVAIPAWRQTPRWRLASCAFLGMFALAIVLGGCGAITSSGPAASGTPKGATSFTVTGTSGTTTISTVVNVTVQ